MGIQHDFGQRVKELRKQKDISQEALAHLAGLDRTYVTSLENGRRNVSIQTIQKIIDALGISFFEFFSSAMFNQAKSNKS
jgi:transcriptional regulator with XRE-family HTH domain